MTSPLVSVLFTTYNHAPYIEEALDSVAAQTLTDFELIISDDFSTDNSAAVIDQWLARNSIEASVVVSERNLGICAVRNRDLARARGEFICTLSGDDLFAPDRLERQAAALSTIPSDVAAVYSDIWLCDEDSRRLPDPEPLAGYPSGWIFSDLQRNCFIPAQSVMVRKGVIESVGGYDESLAFEDWDMWLRLADRYRFIYVPMLAGGWRQVRTSLWHSNAATALEYEITIAVHSKWLDRDAHSAKQAAGIIRVCAVELSRFDREAALEALRSVHGIPSVDSIPWGTVERLLANPRTAPVVEFAWKAHMHRRRAGW